MYIPFFVLCFFFTSLSFAMEQEKVLKRPAEDIATSSMRRRIELTDEIKVTLIRFLLSKDFDQFFQLADSFEPGKRKLIYTMPIRPAGTTGDVQEAKATVHYTLPPKAQTVMP